MIDNLFALDQGDLTFTWLAGVTAAASEIARLTQNAFALDNFDREHSLKRRSWLSRMEVQGSDFSLAQILIGLYRSAHRWVCLLE